MEINVSKVILADSIKELDKKSKEIMEKQIFKIGDKVYHIQFGWGIISEMLNEDILVGFVNGRTIWANRDSNLLSFTEYTLQGFNQERPIELPEVGELCLVRDSDISVWQVGKFRGYDSTQVYPFKTDVGSFCTMRRIKILY